MDDRTGSEDADRRPEQQHLADPRVVEMTRLLAEGTEHSLTEDGHCKSSEGAISVHYMPFAWREAGYPDKFPEPAYVEVYSYLLGPHRNHSFTSLDEALETVRGWHAEEMSREVES